jgi:hypothetical protein
MVPLWFTLSALCFVGAVVLLYVDIDRRRGRSRRRKSWARSHGFDYERESTDILKRWKRGVMSTVGDVPAHNVVLGQIRGEAVYIFDLEEVATVIALHRKVGTNVVDAARRACDRRMVTFAHTAPDCAEIMWNEQNWTLVSMPIASTRAQWDEGLRTVRQFNDLLRVLPPLPQETEEPVGLRNAAPSRPLAPAGRAELPQRRAEQDVAGLLGDVARRPQREPVHRDEGRSEAVRRPPPVGRTGRQATNYQR